MSLFIATLVQKVRIVLGLSTAPATAAPEEQNPATTASSDIHRELDKRHPGQKPAPVGLFKRIALIARPKRHRKEINMFPPAKVYAKGRHEVKTRHSKGPEGTTHAKKRGGHNK